MDPVSAILEYLGKMKKNIIHYMLLSSHSVDSMNTYASSSLQCSYAKTKKSNGPGLSHSRIFRENEKKHKNEKIQ